MAENLKHQKYEYLKECELCLGTGGNNYWNHLHSRYGWEYCPNCLNGIVIKLAKTVEE
jgi:hypothetical protein